MQLHNQINMFQEYNNYRESILSPNANSSENLLHNILIALEHEKSDNARLEYIHFINENIITLITEEEITTTIKALNSILKDIIYCTN